MMLESLMLYKKPPSYKTYEDLQKWHRLNSKFLLDMTDKPTSILSESIMDFSYISVTVNEENPAVMYGSPRGTHFGAGAPYEKLIRHSAPSESVWKDILTTSNLVIFKIWGAGLRGSMYSRLVNGLLSESAGSMKSAMIVDFIYYDTVEECVMRCNPFTISLPEPFNGQLIR